MKIIGDVLSVIGLFFHSIGLVFIFIANIILDYSTELREKFEGESK